MLFFLATGANNCFWFPGFRVSGFGVRVEGKGKGWREGEEKEQAHLPEKNQMTNPVEEALSSAAMT
jgi:hypothetical protein